MTPTHWIVISVIAFLFFIMTIAICRSGKCDNPLNVNGEEPYKSWQKFKSENNL